MRRFVLLVLLVGCAPAIAVIIRLTALNEIVAESTFIVEAKITTLDAKRPAMMLDVVRVLKGKSDLKKLPVLIGTGDAGARKRNEAPQLLQRVAEKLPVVVFVSQRDQEYTAFVYSDGTWYSLNGQTVESEVRWSFAHLEPYLRRTYKGTTAELLKLLEDGKAMPKPDAKEKPGLGPPLKKADEPMRGVIPMVLIGGPLALLAMLFPGVFAGWDRWLALLSTAGTASTMLLLLFLGADWLRGTWLESPVAVWALLTLVHLSGLFWSMQRHAARVKTGDAPLVPGSLEVILLGIMALLSLAGLAGLAFARYRFKVQVKFDEWWPVIAYGLALGFAALYAVGMRLRGPRLRPATSCEAVFLFALVAACVPMGPVLVPPRIVAGATDPENLKEPRLVWTFALPARGAIVSSPLVHAGRVYVAAAHDDVFRPYGRLYCLDRETGKVVWTFDNGKKMKQAFSSPVFVGGKLYIGEGLHQDEGCKLFELDPTNGTKKQEFETASHTEATPVVILPEVGMPSSGSQPPVFPTLAAGRIYQGAGDDGLYCLDTKFAKVWNFAGFHIDTGPAVDGDGVYIGSGVGDAFKETAIFRLHATTGKPVWRVPTDLPVWTELLVSAGRVYAGMGNGRLNEEPEKPMGLVLALDAKTGNEAWRVKLKDGVLGRMALDGLRLYFGCRDGIFYCLRRRDGSTVWSRDVGGPIVAGPALDRNGEDAPERLYVTAVGGPLACLDPMSGRVLWTKALSDGLTQVEAIATPALEVRDGVRRLYVGLTLTSAARLGELRCYEE